MADSQTCAAASLHHGRSDLHALGMNRYARVRDRPPFRGKRTLRLAVIPPLLFLFPKNQMATKHRGPRGARHGGALDST